MDYLDNEGCVKCENGYGLIDILESSQFDDVYTTTCIKMDYATARTFDHDPNCINLIGKGNLDSLKDNKINCLKCKEPVVTNNVLDEGYVLST